MKETSFIEQNKEKWKRFQELAANKQGDPEEIADLYSDITDDLSYAQTFYNRRTVRVYLNQIAQGIHNLVHKERSESLGKFFTVWKTSLPIEIYRSRKHLLFALCLFLFWAVLGAVTTDFNPDFPRVILGDDYVDMTLNNIANKDPLAVYQSQSQVKMFFDITINNIRVAFLTFILGIFFTIGTHIFIFQNGVMLGAFQYFFHLKGVLITSFLGIWIHGAFEISAIVIAGGAGITLGNGWLFPGSYTRLQSLQVSAKRGLKIKINLLLTLPLILVMIVLQDSARYEDITHQYWYDWAAQMEIMMGFGMGSLQDVLVMLGWTYVFAVLMISVFYGFKHQEKKLDWGTFFRFCFKNLFGVWLCNLMLYVMLFLVPWYWLFICVFLIPFFWLNSVGLVLGNESLGQRIRNGFSYSARAYGNTILSISVLSLILFLFAQPIALVFSIHDGNLFQEPPMPDLLDMLADFVKNISRNFTEDFMVPAMITRQVVYLIFMFLILPFFAFIFGFIYFYIY